MLWGQLQRVGPDREAESLHADDRSSRRQAPDGQSTVELVLSHASESVRDSRVQKTAVHGECGAADGDVHRKGSGIRNYFARSRSWMKIGLRARDFVGWRRIRSRMTRLEQRKRAAGNNEAPV